MPIALSPSHPRYGKVPARGRGAAHESTQPANDNTHAATSTPMIFDHSSTPPRHSRHPSGSSSISFGFDRTPPFDQAFLDALEAPVTPTRSSSPTALSLFLSPNHGARSASIRTRTADALLPPPTINGPTKENSPFYRHLARRSPTTPTRHPSSRPKRPCPRTRQVKPLVPSTSAPDGAQNQGVEAGPSKGKGKRRAEDSEEDEPSLISLKRARTVPMLNVPINLNVVENAAAQLQPAPQSEPAPALMERPVRKEKRRIEDELFPSHSKRTRFAIDAPAAKLAALLEEAENEDAAGPSSELQFGRPGSISPACAVHHTPAQGPDHFPSARVKRSAPRPSAFRSAHDRRAVAFARRARLQESPITQASRRLQAITISDDCSITAPGFAHALLWPTDFVQAANCAESEVAREAFDSNVYLDFSSGQGVLRQVEASAMDWAGQSDEAGCEDTAMASPPSSPGPRGRISISTSCGNMDAGIPGSVDSDTQDEVPAYLRPFRVDRDGDVIMHGPCTLHIPSDKRVLKAAVASDVKKRRLKASAKRRRSYLPQ